MAIENELKFLPPLTLKRAEIEELLSKHFNISSTKNILIEDSYYDTANQDLKKVNSSFRIRQFSGKTLITYKRDLNSESNIKQREEFEVEIPSSIDNSQITFNLALQFLKKRYPKVDFPTNLSKQLVLHNSRQIDNLKLDNNIVEFAWDQLSTSSPDTDYDLENEMEFEVKSGDPKILNEISNIILDKYPNMKKNSLSKYSRALDTISGKTKSLNSDEVILCHIISNIIKSKEFLALKGKTQMITYHGKPVPENLFLDDYSDSNILMQDILNAKNMPINNNPKNIKEMFCCFFNNANYNQLEKVTADFLTKNFYNTDSIISNRYTHSLQVMLMCMLTAKRFNISNNLLLLTGANGLFHDIGHVPFSHECEKFLNLTDGCFSHEQNGAEVFTRILNNNKDSLINNIGTYYKIKSRKVPTDLTSLYNIYTEQIKNSIIAHSTKRYIGYPKSSFAQFTRCLDKVYALSDAIDISKWHLYNENLFNDKHLDAILESAKESNKNKLQDTNTNVVNSFNVNLDTLDIHTIENYLNKIKKYASQNDYGKIATLISNSVIRSKKSNTINSDINPEMWFIINELKSYTKALRQDDKTKKVKHSMSIIIGLAVSKILNDKLTENPDIERAYISTIADLTKLTDIELLKIAKKTYLLLSPDILENIKNPSLLDLSTALNINIDNLASLNFYEHQLKIPSKITSPEEILEALNITDFNTSRIMQCDTYYDNKKTLFDSKKTLLLRKIYSPTKDGNWEQTQTFGIYKSFKPQCRYISRKSARFVLPPEASQETLIDAFKKYKQDIDLPEKLKTIFAINAEKTLYEFHIGNELVTISIDNKVYTKNGFKLPNTMEISTNNQGILTYIKSALKKRSIEFSDSNTFEATTLVKGLGIINQKRPHNIKRLPPNTFRITNNNDSRRS